jgi:Mor family transcriptional regulator
MRSRKAEAVKILPPDLVEQIQKYFTGGYLYVPSRMKAKRLLRNMEIISMFIAGKTVTEISETFLLSRTGVRYILKAAKRDIGGGSNAG